MRVSPRGDLGFGPWCSPGALELSKRPPPLEVILELRYHSPAGNPDNARPHW